MAVVRFKFRSSPAFEPVPIPGGAVSISSGDLRRAVFARSRSSDGSRLLLFDAATGLPFGDRDEECIPAGTDIIVRRVPIEATEGDKYKVKLEDGIGESLSSQKSKEKIDNTSISHPHDEETLLSHLDEDLDLDGSDDFGDAVCNVGEPSLPVPSNANASNVNSASNKHQSISGIDVVQEATSREFVGENSDETRPMDGLPADRSSLIVDSDLPSELRCLLCSAIFKEAVMIPCCQHSFCEECVRLALGRMRRCPNCYSTKCNIDDLLPNLSLRRAINHFLDAQASVAESSMPKYAPDGESEIQAKEVSCTPSIHQQEQGGHCCASATENESRPIVADSTAEKKINSSGFKIHLTSSNAVKAVSSDRGLTEVAVKNMVNFQGSCAPSKITEGTMHEGGNLPIPRLRESTLNSTDGNGIVVPPIRPRKHGDRTCYMCGSPSHLIRDCPVANNSLDAAFQGVGGAYWHGQVYNHMQPYGNMYGNMQHYGNMYGTPGMIPYSTVAGTISPFVVTPYMNMNSLYSGMASSYGMMRMGGMPLNMLARPECPSNSEYTEFQDGVKKYSSSYDHAEREQSYDGRPGNNGKGDESEQKSQKRKERPNQKISEGSSEEGTPKDHSRCSKDGHQNNSKEIYSSGRDSRKHGSEKQISELRDANHNHCVKHKSRQLDESRSGEVGGLNGKYESERKSGSHHRNRREEEQANDGGKVSKHKSRRKRHDSSERQPETALKDHRLVRRDESSRASEHHNEKPRPDDRSREYTHKSKESSHISQSKTENYRRRNRQKRRRLR